ncbi:hypothetical protein LUZ60_004282 [Juncus effusus]|nr:hypothetical protein LUZ60_004282 [Juncus effusus]
MADHRGEQSWPPLIPPRSEIHLEYGGYDQILCRICLEDDGGDFISPCKCKGTSKYVHRHCLDQWRAVKEGFAFSHCTTCKAPYYLRVQVATYRNWRRLKFRFFVTRDILFIFAAVQLVISALAYVVYFFDSHNQFWLFMKWGFDHEIIFYYACGALLFFAFVGLSGCCITCFDESIRSDPSLPCAELCYWCCQPSYGTRSAHYNHMGSTDCTFCCLCSDGHFGECGDCCDCNSGSSNGDSDGCAYIFLIIGLVVLVALAVVGIFYSVLVATMIGQRIWQRHYHILAKRMLTKEYVVESVDFDGTVWSPPPLPLEHVEQLNSLGLI